MALKGLDIFKMTPKTNCKECGSPTCMAFSMKVAQGAVDISKCPHMSAEALATLSEATAPPMKSIKVGTGDAEYTLGGETVLFRHEKTYVSKPRFAVRITPDMDADAVLAAVNKVDYDRIGERMHAEMVFVEYTGDAAAYAETVKHVTGIGKTIVLECADVEAAKAALEVCEKYQGELPADYEDLLSLPGIGSYTAGAIASIAYGISVPAVDGNVFRVVCRLTENGADVSKQSVRRQIEQQVKEIIPAARAGDFNQALMELGAVVCVPNGQARCGECPLEAFCQAKKNDRIQEYPYKAPKKARTIQEKTVLVIQDGEKVVLKKRPEKGLLAGLYEFPNKAGVLDQKTALKEVEKMGLLPLRIQPMEEAKHIFSHVEWRMHGYQIRVEGLERKQKKLIYADKKQVQEKYAIPSAFSAFIKYLNLKEEEEK